MALYYDLQTKNQNYLCYGFIGRTEGENRNGRGIELVMEMKMLNYMRHYHSITSHDETIITFTILENWES